MIYALDVDYNGDQDAVVASIGFNHWEDASPSYAQTHFVAPIEPYKAGSFYKRELPCLLEALRGLEDIDCVVVDGYVWLEEEHHAGLGRYLYDALHQSVPIIGVAKSKFNGTPQRCELRRGASQKPLFITAVGIALEEAKELIASMSGNYRFPTLLKEVDSLCRGRTH